MRAQMSGASMRGFVPTNNTTSASTKRSELRTKGNDMKKIESASSKEKEQQTQVERCASRNEA